MGAAGSRLLTWSCYAYALKLLPGLVPLLRAAPPELRRRLSRWAVLVAACLAIGASKGKNRIVQLVNSEFWQIFSVPAVAVATLAAAAIRTWRGGSRGAMKNLLQFVVIYGSVPSFVNAIREFAGPDRGADVDVIAMLAILLGVLRKQNAAALMILLMVTGGEALEHIAVNRAKVSLEGLLAQKPSMATRVRGLSSCDLVGEGGATPSSPKMRLQRVPVDEVSVGQFVQVRHAEMIPLDGIVARGSFDMDDSSLTGEKTPTHRRIGDAVLSGSLNLSENAVIVRATKPAAEGTFQLISARLEECLDTKAGMEESSLHYASLFTPFSFALATFGYVRSGRNWDTALSVLMAATPCPLSIGCPVAFLAGMSVAAKNGITVKNRAALENAGRVTALVLDKTGTLTEGTPSVQEVRWRQRVLQEQEESFAIQLVASVESNSTHPLAKAIKAYAEGECSVAELFPVEGMEQVPGSGVRASVVIGDTSPQDGGGDNPQLPYSSAAIRRRVAIGTLAFVAGAAADGAVVEVEEAVDAAESSGRASRMTVYVSVDGELWGHIRLADAIRPEAAGMLSQVKSMGVKKVVMLTGDSSGDALRVAATLGIADVQVCLPLEKVAAVEKLKAAGERVLMIGDGINDTPALQAAHVGVSLGVTDLVSEGANVVFLKNSLSQLPQLVHLGQQVLRVASLGVTGGMSVSLLQMFLAASGRVPPLVNACMQEVVDLSAVLNSLRVLGTDLNQF